MSPLLHFTCGSTPSGTGFFRVWGPEISTGLQTSTEPFIVVPRDGTLLGLHLRTRVPAGAGTASMVVTVRKGGVATALTATMVETDATVDDATHSVAVVAGDQISLGAVVTGTFDGSGIRAVVEYATQVLTDAVGTSAGTSTPTGVADAANDSVGTSAGTSTADAVSISSSDAVGTAVGTSAAAAAAAVTDALVQRTMIERRIADYELRWTEGSLDMTVVNDDLGADDGLRTACLLSLFTDRRAEDDDPIPALDQDRRGWWADQFLQVDGDRFGSRLWLLDRSKRTGDVVRRAEELVREALQWTLEDRVASRIDVAVETRDVALLIHVTLYRPQRDPVTFRFAHVWDGELRPDQPDELVPGYEFFRWDAGQGWDAGIWS
jgi:phage gp46-like protein